MLFFVYGHLGKSSYRFSLQISVVKETRMYRSWTESAEKLPESCVSQNSGIMCAKRTLNELHKELSNKGYDQVLLHALIYSL